MSLPAIPAASATGGASRPGWTRRSVLTGALGLLGACQRLAPVQYLYGRIRVPYPEKPANDPLPIPSLVRYVTNLSQLQDAIANAASGERIVLGNGTYGALTIGRAFDPNQPLQIVAREPLQAEITGPWSIRGSGLVVKGLLADGFGRVVSIEGNANHVRLTTSKFLNTGENGNLSSPLSVIDVSNGPGKSIRNIRIDHVEIGRYAVNGIAVSPDGIIQDVQIDNCHIRDHLGSGSAERKGVPIYIGGEADHSRKEVRAEIMYCLIKTVIGANVVELKSKMNRCLFVHIVRTTNHANAFNNRHGTDNVFACCRGEGGVSLNVNDWNCLAIGNDVQKISVKAGNCSPTYGTMPSKPELGFTPRPTSLNARVIANKANLLRLGQFYDSYESEAKKPCKDTWIYQHTGPIEFVKAGGFGWHGTYVDKRNEAPPAEFPTPPPPVTLTPADVGPGVATA